MGDDEKTSLDFFLDDDCDNLDVSNAVSHRKQRTEEAEAKVQLYIAREHERKAASDPESYQRAWRELRSEVAVAEQAARLAVQSLVAA